MAAPSCHIQFIAEVFPFSLETVKKLIPLYSVTYCDHLQYIYIYIYYNIYIYTYVLFIIYVYNWGVYHPQLVINQPSLRSSSFRGLIQFRHAASAMMCNLGHGALSKKRVLDGLSIPPIFQKMVHMGIPKNLIYPLVIQHSYGKLPFMYLLPISKRWFSIAMSNH